MSTGSPEIPPEEQDRLIGRDRSGGRLDLPAGTTVATEPEITGDVPWSGVGVMYRAQGCRFIAHWV